MRSQQTSAVRLHHVDEGPADAPAVLLGASLGTTLSMWDELAERLATRYRVIRFDLRGHGGSPVPAGPYAVEELTSDVVDLAESLGLDRFGYVGLSIGGAIGQTLALSRPDLVAALVLCCTAPSFGDPAPWLERARRVRAEGMAWLVEPTRGRWFRPGLVRSHPERCEALLEVLVSTPPEGYAACCEALASYDLTSRLGEISTPTRVVAGAEDPVCPPGVGKVLADGIPDADLVVVWDASHIANVEQPETFGESVAEHLERHL